ncbi:pilus assembly FimT family protein [Aeoliella mucimassa]|uniref:Uncharacterized protein n=1 Tax=Aeoliella mucimassa TaxID=2527972 RepID=A0A518AU83_9BACT|nr:type II secretion system protein [Aeoliella mucimassa]QDU58266.1 hypothetical protein Pan181_44990 [Aeoliella mucimassa]
MKLDMRKANVAGKAIVAGASAAPATHGRRGRAAAGLTLVELLVVIVILATLTAAALPVLTPSTTERRIRETSRSLNTFIAMVQAQAIRTGRPSGIALKRLSSETNNANDRGVCIEVVHVEQPAPYTGFDENSRMRVALTPDANNANVYLDFVTKGIANNDSLPNGWDADLVPQGVLRVGDVVEVLGSRFRIVGTQVGAVDPISGYLMGNAGNTTDRQVLIAQVINNTGQLLNPVSDSNGAPISSAYFMAGGFMAGGNAPPYWSEPVKYKILRQPTPTAQAPYQLPNGIAIDLEASGILGGLPFHVSNGNERDALINETPDDTPIYVMFNPEGSIERVQQKRVVKANDTLPLSVLTRPTNNVALLVGRRELIPAATGLNLTTGTETEIELEKAKLNWLNTESRWIVVGAQTGSVVTTENAFVNTKTLTYYDADRDGDTDDLDQRMIQIQAAQEFAREMNRSGGS